MFKVEFLSRPNLEPSDRDGYFRFVEDFSIRYRGETYTVPAGFETDGASIPNILTPICGSKFKKPRCFAAFVHDYFYSGVDPEVDRAEADDLYRDIQIGLGVKRWKAYLEWRVLRLFGWIHWQEFVASIVGAAGGIALSALLSGCVEIANVESFVTVPSGIFPAAVSVKESEAGK